MLDRSLEAEFESYRKTISTDEARRAFDERIERLLSQHGVDYVRGYVGKRICLRHDADGLSNATHTPRNERRTAFFCPPHPKVCGPHCVAGSFTKLEDLIFNHQSYGKVGP
jgi:hypothetical protein